MWSMQKVETLFFEILFVMTETVGTASNFAFQKTLFLYWIDLAQVLRVMTSEPYGWSEQSYDLMRFFDLVYVLADLVAKVIPRYSLFILASFLVMLALADTAYAAKLFSTATKVQTMWPIKLLKFLVGTTVTILFSSVLKWLIIPIECEVSKEKSLSSYLHGEGARCTPWAFPDAFFSAFTMLALVIYSCFAFTVSLLAFETNPLRRGVQAQSTGRVEACWIAIKVTVTMMTYVTNWIGSLPCAVLLNAAMLFLCYYHNSLLPFHRHETNLIRGGVFGFTTWLSFATVLVAATEVPQAHQWGLLAFAPVFFVVGLCLTHSRRMRIDVTIERLRAEFTATIPQADRETMRSRRRRSSVNLISPTGAGPQPMLLDAAAGGAAAAAGGSAALQRFFDPTWESRKAFASENRAMIVLRTLLYRRDKADLPLLLWLSGRAMEEYPDSVNLRIFELLIVRFVKENHAESNALEKKYQMDRKSLAIDYRYALFALERAKIKESAGANLGKGMYSVINVMEFDAGMERSKNGHMECIVGLKKFWAATRHLTSNQDNQKLMLQDMVKEAAALDIVIDSTRQEYKTLVELYPTSNTLLRTYALFCETILNDTDEAEKWRSKADALDDPDEDSEDALSTGMGQHEERKEFNAADAKSSGSGLDSQASRNKALQIWKEVLLKGECGQVRMLHRYIRLGLVLMLVCSLGSYITMNRLVLNNVLGRMDSIQTTLKFAMTSSVTTFLLREMQLDAKRGLGEGALDTHRDEVTTLMTELQHNHKHLYESHPEMRSTYNDPSMPIREPLIRGGWQYRNDSFWNLNIEYARRVQRAVATTVGEFADDSYRLQDITDEKRNVAFVFENTDRNMLPWYLKMLEEYTSVVEDFVAFAWTLVQLASAVSPTLLVLVSGLVLWKLRRLIPKMQSKRMSVIMALRFPRRVQHKISEFYNRLQNEMLEIEDEERCWEAIQDGEEGEGSEEQDKEEHGDATVFEHSLQWWQRPAAANADGDDFEERAADQCGGVLRQAARDGTGDMSPDRGRRMERDVRGPLEEEGGGHAAARRERLKQAMGAEAADAAAMALTERNVKAHISRDASGGSSSVAAIRDDSRKARSDSHASSPLRSPISGLQPKLERIDSAPTPEEDSGNETPVLANEEAREGEGLEEGTEKSELGAVEGAGAEGEPPEDVHEVTLIKMAEDGWTNGDPVAILSMPPAQDAAENEDGQNHMSGPLLPLSSDTPVVARKDLEEGKAPRLNGGSSNRLADHVTNAFSTRPQQENGHDHDDMEGIQGVREGPQSSLHRAESNASSMRRAGRGVLGGRSFKGRKPRSTTLHATFMERASDGSGSDAQRASNKGSFARKPLGKVRSLRAAPNAQEMGEDTKAWKRSMLMHQSNRSSKRLVDSGKWKRYAQDCEASVRWQEGRQVERKRQGQPVVLSASTASTPKGTVRSGSASPGIRDGMRDLRRSSLRSREGSVVSCEEVRRLREENLELTELPDEMLRELDKEMLKHRDWHTRTDVWVFAMFMLVGLFLFSTLYPVRILPDMMDLILILDHGGRRNYLMESSVFWAQELILDDGLSRAHTWEVALSLQESLGTLRREHEAVRLGGDRGIEVGADLRFSRHNEVMYEPDCVWRAEGGECDAALRPEARKHGLHHLLVTFLDAGQAVLHKYAPLDYGSREGDGREEAAFEELRFNMTRVEQAEADPDMAFMRQEARGDLLRGLEYVQKLFNDEATGILNRALMENNILFALYSLAIVMGWYGNLFRSVVKSAFLEASRAQRFVARLPLAVLSKQETKTVEIYFHEQQAQAAADQDAAAFSTRTPS